MSIVIATTGTGGDFYPGIAVGEFLRSQKKKEVQFVISGLGPEEEALERLGFPYEKIHVGKLKGQDVFEKMTTLLEIPKILWKARTVLKACNAEAVLGAGGHSAGPVVLSARLLKIPTALFEPNRIPGLSNRLLCHFVDRIYTGFPNMESHFPKRKTVWTGTPVRSELSTVIAKEGGTFTLLVIGGSQGAATLNRVLLEATPLLVEAHKKVKIIHQTGRSDFENVRRRYESMEKGSIEVQVFPFIHQMQSVYQEADLIICRAGASTIAELIAVRRPSILVPYPFAANDHQRWNALSLVEAGASEMILDRDITGEKLAQRIIYFESNRKVLEEMKRKISALPGRESAGRIANELVQMGEVG